MICDRCGQPLSSLDDWELYPQDGIDPDELRALGYPPEWGDLALCDACALALDQLDPDEFEHGDLPPPRDWTREPEDDDSDPELTRRMGDDR